MIVKDIFLKIALLACGSLLVGCLPSYNLKPDSEYATVKLTNNESLKICEQGRMFRLSPINNNREARVRAGEKISLAKYMSFHGHNVIYSCQPVVTFMPEANETYVLDYNVISNRCFIEVAKEDLVTKTGLVQVDRLEKNVCRR